MKTYMVTNEPLLRKDDARLVLYPIKNPRVWEMYNTALASFWTPAEIPMDGDRDDFEKLPKPEREFLKYTLAFFAVSDGVVLENLVTQFCSEVQIPEARCFYAFQAMIENIHAETYSLLIDTLISDRGERDHLLNAIQTMPPVRAKAEWALGYIDEKLPFAERLVAFAAVEGVMFSASFASVFWIKNRGILQGTTTSNDLIARDEGMHTDFACLLYSMLQDPLSDEKATEIITSAVDVERTFVHAALPQPLEGMHPAKMEAYVEFVADRLLQALGHPIYYHRKNPFPWMAEISLQRHSNFFEQRVTEYHRPLNSGMGAEAFKLVSDF